MTDPTLVFLDTETTGLDPDRHEIWEIGAVVRGHRKQHLDGEWWWQIQPDLTTADPTGLRVGRFYEREQLSGTMSGAVLLAAPNRDRCEVQPATVAGVLARLFDGAHLVGAVPSFDASFLAPFLRKHGQAPTWHYHLVDVEAMAAGWIHGTAWLASDDNRAEARELAALPWNSDDLTRSVGADLPAAEDRHTALAAARWAMATFDAITGSEPVSFVAAAPAGEDS